MPDGITDLCRFYADQYGMIFHTVYDPRFFIIKGDIVFRNTRKNFSIMCAGMTEKEIIGHFHTIIYDVLAAAARLDVYTVKMEDQSDG